MYIPIITILKTRKSANKHYLWPFFSCTYKVTKIGIFAYDEKLLQKIV